MKKLYSILSSLLFVGFAANAELSTADSGYSQDFIDLVELLYGEGYLSQGGDKSVDYMLKGMDLSNKKVLDVGSGIGGIDIYLATKYKVNVAGVDIESAVVDMAKKKAVAAKDTLKGSVEFYLEKEGDNLKQFADESFDVVFSKETLLHIPVVEKVTYLKEIYRVLKKGGKLVVMDWMHTSPNYSKELKDMIELDGIAYNLITDKEYLNNLKEAGFKDINFEDTSVTTVQLSKGDCDTIKSKKAEIEKRFGLETYEESLSSWTAQYNIFKNNELQTGIFTASK
ncbi:MAG TPA: methyltransferase domain-containing protein [Candidatus Babeliales bacterium]|nr:methyltransferase domain-containing protein [Candidatus Babeliales bacterium]